MNKIEKTLLNSIENMQGYVLGFGNIDDKIIKAINKNNEISEFVLLSDDCVSDDDTKSKRTKKIPYRRIRKKFKKKNVTNIIASYDELGKYHRRFISDSLFLSKQNIYVFIKNEDIDIELIEKRYKRYHQKMKLIECSDGFLLHIEKIKYRKNVFRDKIYLFIDLVVDGINFIGDLFIV